MREREKEKRFSIGIMIVRQKNRGRGSVRNRKMQRIKRVRREVKRKGQRECGG